MRPSTAALLVLADGSVFEGETIGAPAGGPSSGEVVFNTSLTGYQEIITDPSYAGQIITFTYPHIGNYGAGGDDNESRGVFARGLIVGELSRRRSSWRASEDLSDFCVRHELSGIAGIDTRRLTRLIRSSGAMPGAFGPVEGTGACDELTLRQAALDEPGTSGVDLVAGVSTIDPYSHGAGLLQVVAYDFGIKTSILAELAAFATVEVVPAATTAADVLARKPDGVFLSNGPGDPETVRYASEAIADLVGEVPIFGICLGHQLLAQAVGAEITKLRFGHHGANHPVRDETTGRVEMTSQNHNFAVVAESVGDVADITHTNLNDGVCEGMSLRGERAFSVQHHPEANPGPHDSRHLFGRFRDLMQHLEGGP